MVPVASFITMGISAAISILLPVVLMILFNKKYGCKIGPCLLGAASFIVFALVLEQILHLIVLRPDGAGNIALASKPVLYTLYGCFAAGIFEETGRFVSFNILKKKHSGVKTALSYGIGHGGIEAILLAGLSMITNIVLGMLINSGGISLLPAAIAESTSALITTSPFTFLASGIERLSAIIIHISLSVLVWYSVKDKRKRYLYPAAIVLHALINVPAVLFQLGIMANIVLLEALIFVLAVGLAFTAYKLHKALSADDIEEELDDEAYVE